MKGRVHDTKVEPYRVRHVMTGLYVGGFTLASGEADIVHTIELQLVSRPGAWEQCRATAEMIASLWIALSGDRGIEIEPIEEGENHVGSDRARCASGGV